MVKARAAVELKEHWVERWFSQKYGLAPNSPALQDRVAAEVYVEYIADLMAERASLRELAKKKTGHDRGELDRRLRTLDHVIDGKPLIDEFEDALMRGQRPQLGKKQR